MRFLSYVGFFNYHLLSILLICFNFLPLEFWSYYNSMWYLAMLIWKSCARLIFIYLCGVCVPECESVHACVGLCRGQERSTQCLPLWLSLSLWTRSSPVCLGWLPASSRGPWSLSLDARVPGKLRTIAQVFVILQADTLSPTESSPQTLSCSLDILFWCGKPFCLCIVFIG